MYWNKFSSESGDFISIKLCTIINMLTRRRCVKWVVWRILHPSTSFLSNNPRGDAFYDDGRLLEACRRVCDKGWARVIEVRVEGRPRKSRGRAIAKTPVPSPILRGSSSMKSRRCVRFLKGKSTIAKNQWLYRWRQNQLFYYNFFFKLSSLS